MKHLTALMLVILSVSAVAQTPTAEVQHAAATVAKLHDTMLDPMSFVLDGAYVTKPDKKGRVSYCYAFRSHNKMGGYSEGRAVEDGADKLRLSVFSLDNGAGRFPGYDVGWIAPCKNKNLGRDISSDVKPLAEQQYGKER